MRLIDADALKTVIKPYKYTICGLESITLFEGILALIDSAPTVDLADRPKGECKTCRHRDQEDKKCDCGELERAGCLFPVSDDYFCKFYEKGSAE